jgi:dihydroflavonol-4-reductase
MSMGDRVLVTGATGFLGSHLCRRLVEDGWTVGGLRREDSDTTRLADLDVTWETADVRDGAAVRQAVEGYDRVFHLAGVGLLSADSETVHAVNYGGTQNVLEASEAAGVDRVVFTSTAGTRHRDSGVATEADVATPVGAYQRSKARAEELVASYVERGLDVVTALPTSVFGPGDWSFTGRLLSLATNRAMVAYLPGGASIVGVDDAVDGLIATMERGETGDAYILSGDNLTFGEAVRTLADRAGGTAPRLRVPPVTVHALGGLVAVLNRSFGTRLFPGNYGMSRLLTRRLYYDSSKAARELGYSYEPLAEHADRAIAWYVGEGS